MGLGHKGETVLVVEGGGEKQPRTKRQDGLLLQVRVRHGQRCVGPARAQ